MANQIGVGNLEHVDIAVINGQFEANKVRHARGCARRPEQIANDIFLFQRQFIDRLLHPAAAVVVRQGMQPLVSRDFSRHAQLFYRLFVYRECVRVDRGLVDAHQVGANTLKRQRWGVARVVARDRGTSRLAIRGGLVGVGNLKRQPSENGLVDMLSDGIVERRLAQHGNGRDAQREQDPRNHGPRPYPRQHPRPERPRNARTLLADLLSPARLLCRAFGHYPLLKPAVSLHHRW